MFESKIVLFNEALKPHIMLYYVIALYDSLHSIQVIKTPIKNHIREKIIEITGTKIQLERIPVEKQWEKIWLEFIEISEFQSLDKESIINGFRSIRNALISKNPSSAALALNNWKIQLNPADQSIQTVYRYERIGAGKSGRVQSTKGSKVS